MMMMDSCYYSCCLSTATVPAAVPTIAKSHEYVAVWDVFSSDERLADQTGVCLNNPRAIACASQSGV